MHFLSNHYISLLCFLIGPKDDYLNENKIFDKYCHFGNDMYLTMKQQTWLENLCELMVGNIIRWPLGREQNPTRLFCKFYLHRMTNSNVIVGKCKLVIYSPLVT